MTVLYYKNIDVPYNYTVVMKELGNCNAMIIDIYAVDYIANTLQDNYTFGLVSDVAQCTCR